MHELIEQKRAEIEVLYRGLAVRRLDLFGSALGESFVPVSSDVDVLVESTSGRDSWTTSQHMIRPGTARARSARNNGPWWVNDVSK